jgi:hypothetical protein
MHSYRVVLPALPELRFQRLVLAPSVSGVAAIREWLRKACDSSELALDNADQHEYLSSKPDAKKQDQPVKDQ